MLIRFDRYYDDVMSLDALVDLSLIPPPQFIGFGGMNIEFVKDMPTTIQSVVVRKLLGIADSDVPDYESSEVQKILNSLVTDIFRG